MGIYEHLCSDLQFISLPAEVGEFLLYIMLKMSQVKAQSKHKGILENGEAGLFKLELEDESDGTRKLMSLAPAIESVLKRGGVLLADEIERELHPMLVNFIVAKF